MKLTFTTDELGRIAGQIGDRVALETAVARATGQAQREATLHAACETDCRALAKRVGEVWGLYRALLADAQLLAGEVDWDTPERQAAAERILAIGVPNAEEQAPGFTTVA